MCTGVRIGVHKLHCEFADVHLKRYMMYLLRSWVLDEPSPHYRPSSFEICEILR